MVLALRRGGRPSLSPCQGRRTLKAPLLSANGVSRRYGRIVALAPTSLEVHPGDALALIGPNGAGKSTLLSILAGALDPSDGSVATAVNTRPEGRLGAAEARRTTNASRRARTSSSSPGSRESRTPKEVADRYIGLLDLPDDGRLTAELSAGNQQRLNLAVALLAGPNVLLLDEPTASLDPRQRRLLWQVAAQVRERQGRRRLRDTEPRGARALRHAGRRPRRRGARLRRQPRAVQGLARSGCVRMRRVGLLLKKDLRILGRSPVLVAALIVYPLVFAALVGAVVRYAGDRPTIAFVDLDHLPEQLTVGGQTFNVPEVLDQVNENAELVPMEQEEADRKLANGEVNAEIIVPRGIRVAAPRDGREPAARPEDGARRGREPGRAADTGARLRAEPAAAGRLHRREPPVREPHRRGRHRHASSATSSTSSGSSGRASCSPRSSRRRRIPRSPSRRGSSRTSSARRSWPSAPRTSRSARRRTRSSSRSTPRPVARGSSPRSSRRMRLRSRSRSSASSSPRRRSRPSGTRTSSAGWRAASWA